MDVRVDQAGHERRIAQVNRLRIGGMRHRLARLRDFVAADQDFP